jgi:endonuclease/exonuclease/phosphatase family metal-dependent hydrolase
MVKNGTSGKKRLGVFNSLVLAFNLAFAISLALSYLSVHISPERNWILPFFGLLYPYLVLVNLFFMIYWMLRKRWLFLLSAIVLISGWNHVERTIQFQGQDEVPADRKAIKLLSYNVKNLSNDNVHLIDPKVREKILSFIDGEDPDILCLQEFAVIHPDPELFIDTLSVRLNMPYHAHSHYYKKSKKGIDAIIIFSKFPILDFDSVKKDNIQNYAMYADLLIDTDTARVFNIHLESFRFKHEDYSFLSELDLQFKEDENLKQNSYRIFNKVRTAFSRRAAQVDYLAALIAESPYPVILCGDFNDTPNSYTYQQLSARLQDAFIESGTGLGNTYFGNLPSYRIDYILYDDYYTSAGFRRVLVKYSDHYPVSCLVYKR